MSKNLLFEFNPVEYKFKKEDNVTLEQLENFLEASKFFINLSDKSPLKDDILHLASYYSDVKIWFIINISRF